jgi:DNA-binding NarL/FixJ family response regulator
VAGWRAGQALMRTAERAAGLDHLHRSYRTARTLGARPLAAEIARTLVELGEPVDGSRRSKASGRSAWGGLTRRQREVAEHLALGLTNKEIAHRLYISPRTVDMHVGHILTRLDCRTRAEAVRKLARMGVLTDLPPEIR